MEAPAPSNIINLADKVGERIASRLPMFQASGIALSVCPLEELEDQLDSLTGKKPDSHAATQADFLARRAAILYRCVGELKEAEKQSARLARKLRKAKRRTKR